MRSLVQVKFDGVGLGFDDEVQVGSPSLASLPCAFKLFSMAKARDAGFNRVLWCDASMWAIKDIQPLFDMMARDGYLILSGGNRVGRWCSDACLTAFGVSRDQAMGIPEVMGGAWGIDFQHPAGLALFEQYMANLEHHRGDRVNVAGRVSSDPWVGGHRTQAVLSLLAWKMGLNINHNDQISVRGWTPRLVWKHHHNDYCQPITCPLSSAVLAYSRVV